MHHLFMNKQNRFRIEEAMTSLLAGDVFRDTPLRRPIAIFKLLYYGIFMKQLAKSWASYKRRAKNATMIFTGGTTQLDKSDINPELPKPASVQVSEKKLTT
jgi:hypothetical protein